MGPKAAALVAGIIDQIEGRPLGPGRPPVPTIKVVETLRFFVREEPVAELSPELRNGAAGLRVEGLTRGQRRDSLRR
jgi:hypothetical protein